VRQALAREATQLIGADLVLQGDRPVRGELRDELARRGLRQTQSLGFVSMARKGDVAQLAGVKAVSEGYPLRGKLRIAPQRDAADAPATGIPAPGTVWLDERLAATLGARVGEAIELGDSRFTVSAILTLEPDRGASFFNIAPRLMLREDEVAATGLVQPGSRVWYSLQASGEREPVAQFEVWLKSRLARGENLQSLENARPEIRASIDRSQQFIGLTALLAVILAAVAVGLSTRRYSQRHLDGYAVMRCFGASQSRLFALFAWEFLLLGVAAAVVGALAGYVAQFAIAAMVSGLMLVELPQPTLLPALQGMLVGMALLLGFSLPPLLQLKNVPALRVIRRDIGAPRQGALAGYLMGTLTIAGLLAWQAGDVKLGLIVLGGFALAGVIFAIVSYVALQGLGHFSGGAPAPIRCRFSPCRSGLPLS
jgi:putative ABC transport system permease protein